MNTELDEDGNWPAGCGYQGYEFGASYPDSSCSGGRLLDMDNCDDGVIYEPMDYIPCPICHPWQYIINRADYNGYGEGWWKYAVCFFCAVCLTFSIWKNRILKTEPWRTK